MRVGGDKDKAGPRTFRHCLSCEPDEATVAENNYEGGEAGRGPREGLPHDLRSLKSGACEWRGLKHVNPSLCKVWIDAQARPLMIVTPARHLGGMEDMTDEDIEAVWGAVAAVIRNGWADDGRPPQWEEVVLNVGKFRNIAHAHIKVWFKGSDFLNRLQNWPQEKQILQVKLHELRRLMKIPNGDKLRKIIEAGAEVEGGIELLVRGVFTADDIEEVESAFTKHGKVKSVRVSDASIAEGMIVSMTNVDEAISAIQNLNLTKLGKRNVMCKVKLLKELEKLM